MHGINTPEITLPPLQATFAAIAKAEQLAGGRNYRACGHRRFRRMQREGTLGEFLGNAQALIIGLPDGYAVHSTCERGVGPIRARIRTEKPI